MRPLYPVAESDGSALCTETSLSGTERVLRDAIVGSGAPEAAAVADLMTQMLRRAPAPRARAAIVARFSRALSERHDQDTVLSALGIGALRRTLERAGWATLGHALPSVAALAALAQLARQDRWSRVAAALPVLLAQLPSVRTLPDIEALVQALPVTLRDSLAALHTWVEQADNALVPRLAVPPATAVVVAVLFWQLGRSLPEPASPRNGMLAFVAALPRHWLRLASLIRAGDALLAAPNANGPGALRRLTHVRSGGPGILPAPPLRLEAAAVPGGNTGRGGGAVTVPPPRMIASAAGRISDNTLMAFAAGLVTTGLLMMRRGWSMLAETLTHPAPVIVSFDAVDDRDAWTDTPELVASTAGASADPTLVALLDDVVDIEGRGSVWQAVVRVVAADADTDSGHLAERVQALLVENDVADVVLGHLQVSPSGEGVRRRRSVESAQSTTPVAALEPLHGALRSVSQMLVNAARQLPVGPMDAATAVVGDDARVTLAMARMHLRRWLDHPANATQERADALASALHRVAFSDMRLARVGYWLPALDRHINALLTRQIREATNSTVEPAYIHRNIFTDYPRWPEWAEKQKRAPGPALTRRYAGYPRDMRVRSGLVSSHTLVQAALLPPETNLERAALYFSGMPGDTYFPDEECRKPTLSTFNSLIAGRNYMAEFRDSFDAFMDSCRTNATQPERDAYVEAMKERVAGCATLLNAVGEMDDAGKWLLDTLVRYPSRFTQGGGTLGRALAMPGQDIQVHALMAGPGEGGNVTLSGVLLATSLPSADRAQGAVLVISPARQPVVQQFATRDSALLQLQNEVLSQLHSWVAVQDHARWKGPQGPVVAGLAIDEDLFQHLFLQQLFLRSRQLEYATRPGIVPAEARKDYMALDQRLRALPSTVALPLLQAAHERANASAIASAHAVAPHWLLHMGVPMRGLLRNAEMEDALWLSSMRTVRGLLQQSYPLPARYAAAQLEAAILNRYGVAIDSTRYQLVRFSGGTASQESPSGFVHDAAQKVAAVSLVECAFSRAEGWPDGAAGSYELGIYLADNSTVFDQDTELGALLPGQLISVLDSLDLKSGFIQAINDFWTVHRDDVEVCLRTVYMFSAWQQFAEGSLSGPGLRMAVAATGYMLSPQAQDPAFVCRLADGLRVSWVNLYGKSSTLLRIEDSRRPEVLLYAPGDGTAFREFADATQLDAWLTRVTARSEGRQWLESMFDLADLQDGWFSNGVDTALGAGASDLFQGNRSALLIDGTDLFEAIVVRMQRRTLNDAETLFSSSWEGWREYLMPRLQLFDAIVGLASIVFPPLLPVVMCGSGLEFLLGMQKAVQGRTQGQRHDGAVDAAWGTLGVLLSAPFVLTRNAALSTAKGTRVLPGVQTVVEDAAADPLRNLSERFAQPPELVVEGVRPADNGVYHHAGKQYIRQAGNTYEVIFDDANQTWRLKNPNPASTYRNPVRLNEAGVWEPHSDVGLRGGAPKARRPASQSLSTLPSYQGALQSEMLRSTHSLDGAARDFSWGRTHFERVQLPIIVRENTSLQQLKELFVSGEMEPVQRGALSTIIEQLERNARVDRLVRMEQAVYDAVHYSGGTLLPVSQTLLDVRGGGGMGLCTGLSRLMALAISQGKEYTLVRNLVMIMRRPGEGIGAQLLDHVRDAQGAALLPGGASAQSRIGYDELARHLRSRQSSVQFILTGATHSMAVAVDVLPNARRLYKFFDPNSGLMIYSSADKLDGMLRQLFSSRYFSSLYWASEGRRGETLAEMYGATLVSPHASPSLFLIRQIDPSKLLQLAQQRGWARLLEDIPT